MQSCTTKCFGKSKTNIDSSGILIAKMRDFPLGNKLKCLFRKAVEASKPRYRSKNTRREDSSQSV